MTTFLVLMDAFRHDYLSEAHTPFLYRCAQEGEHYERVVQSLGFCERSEILSGCTGAETGFFTAIGFDPANSSYTNVPGLNLLDRVERLTVPLLLLFGEHFASRAHGRLRRYVNNYFRSKGARMTSHMIPFPFLEYFSLTEDLVDHRRPGVFPRPSILDQLTDAGRSYNYQSFTAVNGNFPYHSDEERLNAVVQACSKKADDLHLIYVSVPDTYGHECGPLSDGLWEKLSEMDRRLERWTQEIAEVSESNRFIFVGDHGMLSVTGQVNAEKSILSAMKKQGLRAKRDFVYFLDSTMMRFWAISERARRIACEAVRQDEELQKKGLFLDEELARNWHVPWEDRRYGDLIWLANPGILVFPDFFHRTESYLGMHGYDPTLPESQGVCIHWGDGIEPATRDSIPLTGVYEVLKKSLEL